MSLSNLITANEARTLDRPVSDAVEVEKMEAYILEVEQTQIKPALGDVLFLALHDATTAAQEPYKTLLEGGTYDTGTKYLTGLKRAIAYAVCTKLYQSGDLSATRYGIMEKRGDYSDHTSERRLSDVVGELSEIAQMYRKECIEYCRKFDLLPCCQSCAGGGTGKGSFIGGLRVRKILNTK